MSQSNENKPTDAIPEPRVAEQPRDQEAAPDSAAETAALRTELEQTQDRVLRLQAEMENVRNRLRREAEESRRYACMPLVSDLLPVMDNIARAIEAAQKESGQSGLLEGVQLIEQQLESVLAAHHCTRINALHQPFDPNFHEAISQQPTNEYPPGTVVIVTREGYLLHDRVVRPSQVIVATAPAAE